jgi:hypothetical protein
MRQYGPAKKIINGFMVARSTHIYISRERKKGTTEHGLINYTDTKGMCQLFLKIGLQENFLALFAFLPTNSVFFAINANSWVVYCNLHFAAIHSYA